MKTEMFREFEYNGLSFTLRQLKVIRKVTILGVMSPPDPGMVMIQDGTKQREVPTLVLRKCPKIDFAAMLTKRQKDTRDQCGGLLGCGTDEKRHLIPLVDCPVLVE